MNGFESFDFREELFKGCISVGAERLIGIEIVHRHLFFERIHVDLIYDGLFARFIVVRNPWHVSFEDQDNIGSLHVSFQIATGQSGSEMGPVAGREVDISANAFKDSAS
jgi:hypothetical protein